MASARTAIGNYNLNACSHMGNFAELLIADLLILLTAELQFGGCRLLRAIIMCAGFV